MNHLAAIGRTPEQFRLPFALWTLPLIGQLIERKLGVVLHATTIARRLHRLGLSPQRPVRRAFQRDADACFAWATRARVNVISAISPRGRLRFRCFRGTPTGPRFVAFLERSKAMIQEDRALVRAFFAHPEVAYAKTAFRW